MSDLVTLRASVGDDDQIVKIWREASRIAHPFLTEDDLAAQERLTRREHLPRAHVVVAERKGIIVGVIATLGNYIGALFVDPQAQGCGIGRRLIEHAQTHRDALELSVYEANHSARGFYERLGFAEAGRSDHDAEGRPLPVLRFVWVRP